MGVKNLWNILSSSGQAITVGSAGSPVIGSLVGSLDDDIIDELVNLRLGDSEEDPASRGRAATSAQDIGSSFAGHAVAIDLSCWVCDSQANQNMHSILKPHLR